MHIVSRNDHPKQPYKRQDTSRAYFRMFEERFNRYSDGETDILPALVFAAVRWFNAINIAAMSYKTAAPVEQRISAHMAMLTPQQMLVTFPPRKDYDGANIGCKDYFSTIEAVQAYPADKPIGEEKLFDFLWDYMNWDTQKYLIQRMGVSDLLLKELDRPSMMESFLAENGVVPKYFQEGPDGKQYLYDPETDTRTRVFPKRPYKIVSRTGR